MKAGSTRKNKQTVLFSTLLLMVGLGALLAMLLLAGWPLRPATTHALELAPPPAVVAPPHTPTAPATPTPPPPLAQIERTTVTPPANGQVITLTTTAETSGWATTLDGQAHFNTPNLHAGVYQGHTYYGLIQVNLAPIPPGAAINYAALELVGLNDRRLGSGGQWQLHLLDAAIDERWSALNFETVAQAEAVAQVPLGQPASGLAANQPSLFVFDAPARAVLAQRLAAGTLSMRISGPTSGADNLFTWDSGHSRHGAANRRVILTVGVSLPPTPLAGAAYQIVTSTPTPQNIVTAAAQAATATRQAKMFGPATPLPTHWVTPIIVTPPATPANTATAAFIAAETTAAAFLYGPATATPANVWTATPSPTRITAPGYGPALATRRPAPTATPTPVLVKVAGLVATPWATPLPTATPISAPPELIGKIAFLSNRSGGPEPAASPLVYVIDPDGGNLAVLTDPTLYELALAREAYSADQRFRVFTKNALRFDNVQVPALYFYDYFYKVEEQITHFGAGAAWDAVWSPTGEQIAFVSNDSGDDEIWVIDRDGGRPQQLTASNEAYNAAEIGKDTFIPEVNGRPSWSPDGTQLVFWSNRSGNRQIWVMDADGSNLHSLSVTSHDDWDPVWFKYRDPARNPSPQ